jgi:hypothetical protein
MAGIDRNAKSSEQEIEAAPAQNARLADPFSTASLSGSQTIDHQAEGNGRAVRE